MKEEITKKVIEINKIIKEAKELNSLGGDCRFESENEVLEWLYQMGYHFEDMPTMAHIIWLKL